MLLFVSVPFYMVRANSIIASNPCVNIKFCDVTCAAVHGITIYDARLDNEYYGAVEVLTHQGWLPVCRLYGNYWSTPESRVVCRQLGYDVTGSPSMLYTLMSCMCVCFFYKELHTN